MKHLLFGLSFDADSMLFATDDSAIATSTGCAVICLLVLRFGFIRFNRNENLLFELKKCFFIVFLSYWKENFDFKKIETKKLISEI